MFLSIRKESESITKKSISDYFQINRNMIVVTVFLWIMNQTKLCLAYNQKENCHDGDNAIQFERKWKEIYNDCKLSSS